MAALASGVVVIALAVGLWRIPAAVPKFLLLCAACALVPAILLEHVSELYAYNAAPYFALLVGLAIASLWQKRKQALAIGLGLAIGCHIFADRQKAALMYANGKAAERLLCPPSGNTSHQMPAGGEIILAESPVAEPRYSIYLLHGLDVLAIGCWRFGAIFGRPDVAVTLMPMEEALTIAAGQDSVDAGTQKRSFAAAGIGFLTSPCGVAESVKGKEGGRGERIRTSDLLVPNQAL